MCWFRGHRFQDLPAVQRTLWVKEERRCTFCNHAEKRFRPRTLREVDAERRARA